MLLPCMHIFDLALFLCSSLASLLYLVRSISTDIPYRPEYVFLIREVWKMMAKLNLIGLNVLTQYSHYTWTQNMYLVSAARQQQKRKYDIIVGKDVIFRVERKIKFYINTKYNKGPRDL